MPIDISSRPTRCSACSPAIPRRWPAPSRSSSAAASRSTSWPTSIPRSAPIPSLTPQQTLEKLTWEGAAGAIPRGCRMMSSQTLRHELRLIEKLDYAPYFLTVTFDRPLRALEGHPLPGPRQRRQLRGLLRAGHHLDRSGHATTCCSSASCRRSAASRPTSTSISSTSGARSSCSGSSSSYGRDHAALCSTVIRYRTKGAIRDVGKALGLTEDLIKMLSSQVWGWSEEGVEDKHVEELNLNLSDRRLRLTLDLARQLIGAPRHLQPASRRLRPDARPARRPGADRAGGDGRPPGDRVGQGRHRRAALHEGRCARARHAHLHEDGVRPAGRAQGRQSRPGDDPGRGPAHLRDDPQGRHARHLPDRDPARRCRCCRGSSRGPSTTW